MTADAIFSIANPVAMSGWVLLAVLPRARWVAGIAIPVAVAALLSLVYVALIVTFWGGAGGGFSSLDDVATLFENRWLLLAGWVHYLAFDLLVGTWEARDARARGVRHWALLPCLALTFLFGPAGWLLYLAVRSVSRRSHPGDAARV